MAHRGLFQFQRGALAGWYTLALIAGCSADSPEAPADLESARTPEHDGGLPPGGLHVVGGGLGGAPDLATAPVAPDMAEVAQVPYPAGPYGNQAGDTLADLTFAGFRLSPQQTDPAALPWDTGIRLADYHAKPACGCMVITYGASWCTACQHEQPLLIADVLDDPGFCVLNILQEGPKQGSNTVTRADVEAWAGRFRQNFPVVMGTAASRMLWNGWNAPGHSIGLPFTFVIAPDTMTVMAAFQGSRPDLHNWAVNLCRQ